MITVIANIKGGVGKSTLSFHLITWLLNNNIKTKAIDLDPQKTLTDIVEVRTEENISPKINISNLSLMNVDNDLSIFDEVIVDVGAQSMVELKYALIKAERIIIPVMPSQADIWATQRFMKLIKSLRRADKFPEILAVINGGDLNPDNYDTQDTYETLQMMDDLRVLDTIIYNHEEYRSALYEGLACFETNPMGKSAIEFNQLANSIYNI